MSGEAHSTFYSRMSDKEESTHSCPQTNQGCSDQEYKQFLESIQKSFLERISSGDPIFQTRVINLFDIFLAHIPEENRQHYNCHACRSFVNKYGGLVIIDGDGKLVPLMWNPVYHFGSLFYTAVQHLWVAVNKADITGVFYSNETALGSPETTGSILTDQEGVKSWKFNKINWHHMAVTGAPGYSEMLLKSPHQAMAEKKEDYRNIQRFLQSISLNHLNQAISLLKTDSLYRSEKLLGQTEWLKELLEKINVSNMKHNQRRRNIIWKHVASAPAGFCHPRSSMIGTLLEDLQNNMPFHIVERRFKDKMHPLQYQRPQALPSKGNVQSAEKIIEKMGIKDSLKRRFARLEEIETLWHPTRNINISEISVGVFSDIPTKESVQDIKRNDNPFQSITFSKFQEEVIPIAASIELLVKSFNDNYCSLLTASIPGSPNILQWNNPFSWYLYHNGSPTSRWGLTSNTFVKVNAITYLPHMWDSQNLSHQGKGAIFILDGAKDKSCNSLCLFPEILKSELREVRSTIEAYSKCNKLEGIEDQSASGLLLDGSNDINIAVKDSGGIEYKYHIDRWD